MRTNRSANVAWIVAPRTPADDMLRTREWSSGIFLPDPSIGFKPIGYPFVYIASHIKSTVETYACRKIPHRGSVDVTIIITNVFPFSNAVGIVSADGLNGGI